MSTTTSIAAPQQQQQGYNTYEVPVKKEFLIDIQVLKEQQQQQQLKKQQEEKAASLENSVAIPTSTADDENEPPKKKMRGMNKNRIKSIQLGVDRKADNPERAKPLQTGELNKLSYEIVKDLNRKKYKFDKGLEVCQHVVTFMQEKAKLVEKAEKEKTAFKPESITFVHTKYKPGEVKKVDFKGKFILAPLTTLGNLPFRRIVTELGCDITIGEMANSFNILKGQKSEVSLLRRHESEKCFGIQLAGSDVRMMSQMAQFIDENVSCDFIDLNCGCPVDSICKYGMGSALMGKKNKLEGIVRGMTEILQVPMTVKMRTSLFDGKDIAHQLFPEVKSWGASALTLHGRSKQQRMFFNIHRHPLGYSKEARWDYIAQCASTVDIPVIGNGDIFFYQDYLERSQKYPHISSYMIGRGALIKPWIFTELQEQRVWDITSQERLDILKKFCNYGMDHYGADAYGVEKTRLFLLEWLSFLYRYVPVGLVERDPPIYKMNERHPIFKGRNELETLMASPNVHDWIKITEMILGNAPDNLVFVPKHKSASYAVSSVDAASKESTSTPQADGAVEG